MKFFCNFRAWRNAIPENVVYLRPPPREIAQYLRVGFRGHRLCEHLLSADKLDAKRFVIEAANFEDQTGLIQTLRDRRAEILLDTNAAELSVAGRYSGSARAAPWAANDRRLEPADFVPGTNRSIIDQIARFGVENEVSAVMAPAHYLGEGQMHWFPVDVNACTALKYALDRSGGSHIAIDYPLIPTYGQLRDPNFRQQIIKGLRDVPFDNLWLRVSNFGADATGSGITKYIQCLFEFHSLHRPIIADHIGGLASLALCAFGASSGFAHGAEGKERYYATEWVNPKDGESGGGGAKTIYIPGLDRRLKVADVRKLFDVAPTAREIFGCSDRTCCGDINKMLSNPEAHFMVQKGRQVQDLSMTPESQRTDRFLTGYLEPSGQAADRATRLKNGDKAVKAKIANASKRLERTEEALASLCERIGRVEFANETPVRNGGVRRRQAGFEGVRDE